MNTEYFQYQCKNFKYEVIGIKPTKEFLNIFSNYDYMFTTRSYHPIVIWLEETINTVINNLKGKYLLYNDNSILVDTILSMYLPDEVRSILNIENDYTKKPNRILGISDEDLFYLKLKYPDLVVETPFDFYEPFSIKEVL